MASSNALVELSNDDIYRAVTGSILTQSFSYEEFQMISCTDYVTAPFELWLEHELRYFINNMISDMSRTFSN
jgi:hypothetical protein